MTEPRWRRYLRFFQRNPAADVDDELRFHFEQRVEQYRASGMSYDDAVAEARRQFGDVEVVRNDLVAIDERIGNARAAALWWDALRADLRTSVRSLARQPGFSAAVIVTLALGLGVNAAMFSFLDRVYLRMPAGVADPGSLRRLWMFEHDDNGDLRPSVFGTGGGDFEAMQHALSNEAVFARYAAQGIVRFDDDPEAIHDIVRADTNYFSLLGVRASVGRFFSTDEVEVSPPAPVAVISDALWSSRYGRDANIIGKTLALNGVKHTVVGVAQPGFSGVEIQRVDVWLPLNRQGPGLLGGVERAGPPRSYRVLSRIARGVTDERIGAVATGIVRRTNANFAREDTLASVATGSIIKTRGPGTNQKEFVMASRLGAVAFVVLLIACANVMNLLLARALVRRRETAVRIALGASRRRLVWLLSIPAVVLSLVAGVAAVFSAQVTGTLLRTYLVPEIHFAEPAIHWRVVAFTLIVAVIAGVLSTIVPALQSSRPDVTGFLRTGAQTGVVHRSLLRTTLVAAQASLSVVLLVGAGLFVRSVWSVEAIRLGFDVPRITLAYPRYDDWNRKTDNAAFARAVDRVALIPRVEQVAFTSMAPFSGTMHATFYTTTDSTHGKGSDSPPLMAVSDNYFSAVGMRIVRGAVFGRDAGASVVVSEAFAREYWPAGDALGQCIRFSKREAPCYTVIGVAENAHVRTVVEKELASYFVPLRAPPLPGLAGRILVIRAAPEHAASVAAATQRILREEFPGSRPETARTETALAPQYRPFRLGALLFGAFGVLALIVATVGVYSSVSYAVNQRLHEFGVRIALGADLSRVVKPVLGRALAPVVAGIVVGIGIALATGRFVASLLYGVEPTDPVVMVGVALMLVATAALAALLPARRASRVDPMIALRTE